MTAENLVGKVLGGRYELLRVIGAGGMGVVYEGVELDLGRRVAIKVLAEHDARALSRLGTEAMAVSGASNPNVVQLLACHTEQTPPFLVMELLHGKTLGATLAHDGAMAPARAVRITVQILSALEAAHRAGILHRDIKAGNVMLQDVAGMGELVKVLDFGLAKIQDGASQTTTGTPLGTLSYMPPEQLLGRRVDARADLYAVGVCLFEMLTGQRPFTGPADGMIAQILNERAPLATTRKADVPPALAAIAARSLEKDAALRFASAYEMAEALRAVDLTTKQPPQPPKASSGRVFGLAVGGVVLLGVLAGVGLLTAFDREAPRPASSASPRPTASPPVVEVAPAPDVPSAEPSAPGSSRSAPRLPAAQRPASAAPSAPAAPALPEAGPPVKVTAAEVALNNYTSVFLGPEGERSLERAAPGVVACAAAASDELAAGDQIRLAFRYPVEGRAVVEIIPSRRGPGLLSEPARQCLHRAVAGVVTPARPANFTAPSAYYNLH